MGLAVITVPLAWVALTGGSDAQPAPPSLPRAAAPSSAPAPGTGPPAGAPGAPTASSPSPSTASLTAVVDTGSGELTVVPGSTKASGPGPVRRYTVSVEGGLGIDAAAFAAEVDATLADTRSWRRAGALALRRVDSGPTELRVVLASPATTDRLCRPLATAGIYSCGTGSTAVLNSMRWLRGAEAYTGRLAEYRQYVVNHEVGHALGLHHQSCRGARLPAPVMMQQTKGVGVCLPSPWPFP